MSDPYESRRDQVIGEYRLLRKLGGGGFSTVYLAEHIHEHSHVAMKILQVPLAKSEDFRDFINEARTIRLRHPHIIPLFDFGVSREEFPFLVMEYASEGTLRDRHPKGSQVPLATTIEYVEQIASALQYAHDRRIIHRDVKPANMLLRADGTLLLSDFGIAKIMEQNVLVSVQTQIGTPIYMAPEQYMGYPCFASDQYALAVVAYEWISGTHPFRGSSVGLAYQHMTAMPPSLLGLLPALSPGIEQVIFRALAKAPEQRFATIQEFAAALRAAVQQLAHPPFDTIKPASPPIVERTLPSPGLGVDTASRYTPPQISIPLTPQPPVVSLSTGFDATEIKSSPGQRNTPLPYDQTYSSRPPIEVPATPPKARRSSSTRRKILVLLSASLVGLIICGFALTAAGMNPLIPRGPALDTNNVSRLVKKWSFQTGGQVTSSPVVADGTVYVGSWNHNVYAVDVESGRKKWAFQTGGTLYTSVEVADGVVYVSSADKNVYAIHAQSGQKKWAFPTGAGVYASPMVADGVVYVGSSDKNVYALDAQSGQKRWAFLAGDSVNTTPAVFNNVVYVGAADGSVYAIDGQSGKQKWIFPTGGPVTSSPVVTDGVVYIGSNDKNLYALDAQTGEKKWAFLTGKSLLFSTPAVADGVVYVGSDDGNLYALDTQSGKQKWAFPTGGSELHSSPTVTNGVVYIGSYDKNVYAIDAQSGKKRWSFLTGDRTDSTPAVFDNVLYAGSNDGNVYAFNLPATT